MIKQTKSIYCESNSESKEPLTLVRVSIVTGIDTELPPLKTQSEPNCDTVRTFVCLSPPFKICDKIENLAKCDGIVSFSFWMQNIY